MGSSVQATDGPIVFEPLDDYEDEAPVGAPQYDDDSQWWDPDMIWPGETQPRWEKAAGRVDFQLSYTRSNTTRVFSYAEIEGEPIDDVRDPAKKRKSVGDWSIGDRPIFTKDDTQEQWISIFTEAALQEGVHEVLEYLMVDNDFWMDPHGEHESEIMNEVELFAKRLRAIRAGKDPNDRS